MVCGASYAEAGRVRICGKGANHLAPHGPNDGAEDVAIAGQCACGAAMGARFTDSDDAMAAMAAWDVRHRAHVVRQSDGTSIAHHGGLT